MEKMKPATILLVEDDPGDQKLITMSLKNQKIGNDVHITGSGEEAMDFLYQRGKYRNGAPRPDLILLDLNMPGMGGKEFLRQIKQDERMKMVPVVILTSSDSDADIIDTYNLHASGYVKKPVKIEDFKCVVKEIEEYWFVLCRLPPREA
jgi:CheY-like chemotaxis protein